MVAPERHTTLATPNASVPSHRQKLFMTYTIKQFTGDKEDATVFLPIGMQGVRARHTDLERERRRSRGGMRYDGRYRLVQMV